MGMDYRVLFLYRTVLIRLEEAISGIILHFFHQDIVSTILSMQLISMALDLLYSCKPRDIFSLKLN